MTNKNTQGFHMIVAAAGIGHRFGGEIPKQYVRLAGKPILRHTLENIMKFNGLKSLRVIIDPDHADLYHDAVKGLDLEQPIKGGKNRNNSINNALNNISKVNNKDIILIHDAVRPFIKSADIANLLENMRHHRAATLATPVSDTLRRQSENDNAADIINRDGLWALQTPQAFYFADLKKAHDQSDKNDTYTDDTTLVSRLGIDVRLVRGSRSNIKITTQDDLKIAEALLNTNALETRTGFGFDVHAFDTVKNARALMLCGLHIPHNFGLAGHSDADVGLHALTDALLGAIGEGDIGHHFPPSDHTFKNMDSAIFLEKTVDMLADKGGIIQNLDVTIICEEPKIGPHRDAMRERIAQITRISPDRVNVKGTTTEKLGFTGRGEGIAAQAVATVRLPSA